jgi:hypothetical protein
MAWEVWEGEEIEKCESCSSSVHFAVGRFLSKMEVSYFRRSGHFPATSLQMKYDSRSEERL